MQRVGSGRLFLRHACLFVLPLVAGLVGIEARMSQIPNAYTYKQSLLEQQRDSVEAIVLGSSHEFEGVDTDLFSRPSFNLAMPSQSLSQSSEFALKYLKTHRRPGESIGAVLALPRLRYVLLGVSYYSLTYRMATTGDDRMGFYMRAYRIFGDTTFRDLINPSNYLYMGIYGWPAVQSLLRAGATADYVGHLSRTGSNREAKPLPEDTAPRSFAAGAASRARYHHEIGVSANIPINLSFMRRLAQECQTKGVTLVLFTSPVTSDYGDAFGEKVWVERREVIRAFSHEFRLAYIDYSRSAAFGWRDFANADHLNSRGAAKFSRMLSDSLF